MVQSQSLERFDTTVVALMDADEARACVTRINGHMNSARVELLRLYEGRGWAALGYSSWRECVTAEFGRSKSQLYDELEAAKIESRISGIPENAPIPTSQLLPMRTLTPMEQPIAWQEVQERSNGKPTARVVEEVVREMRGDALTVAEIAQDIDDVLDPPMEPAQAADLFARPMKPKINRAGDMYEPQGFDACQTPAHAINPLLAYLPVEWMVWEPACGEGMLVEAFYDADRNVIGSDILTGDNFFTCDGPNHWDCLITNPPYSIKYPWLERCYQLGKPFALLLPVETLGAQRAQALFVEHGVQIILFDKRINFKMPSIGWDGSSAQFPVAWFTWGLNLETQIVFAKVAP